MRKSRKPLSAPRFELVRDRTWVITDQVTERYFLLYYEPVGAAYLLTYAELEAGSKYSAALTFKNEIYQTKFWSQPDHLGPLIEALQASILTSSLSSPSQLIYEFGGTYKSRAPLHLPSLGDLG